MNGAPNLKPLVVAGALALVSLAVPAVALACSVGVAGSFEITDGPAPDDVAPPGKPQLSLEFIKRGEGPKQGPNGTQIKSTCDNLGWIDLSAMPSEGVGYEFEIVDGQAPAELPAGENGEVEAIRLEQNATGFMVWNDEASDEQEAIDFTIVARPVDTWGRRGPASDPLRISHPGSSEAACSIAGNQLAASRSRPGTPGLLVSTALLLAFGLVRRRT